MRLKKFCIIISFCYFPIFISAQNWYPVNFPNNNLLNGPVFALHVFNSELYAGGQFWMDINGTKTYSILKWNGTNWDSLGVGIDFNNGIWSGGEVRTIRNFKNKLYVGGQFKRAGNIISQSIAAWNWNSWEMLNSYTFLNIDVNTLQEYNEKLFIAGGFYTLQNDSSYINVDCCIATWDGAIWDSVSAGSLESTASAMIYKNDLYVGGLFWYAGNVPVYYVARYDGLQWHAMELGADGGVGSFAVDTVNNILFVGGGFVNVVKNDSTPLESIGIARWNGSNWDTLPGRIYDMGVYAQKIYHGILCLGGGGVAFWDGKKEFSYAKTATTQAKAMEIYNDTLYVGGYFQYIVDHNGDTINSYGLARCWFPNYCDSAHAIINTVSDTISLQAGDSIQVTSDGFSNQWEWNFGDGAPQDTAEKPVHIYDSAGIFTLKLRATYGLCPWDNDSIVISVNPLGTSVFPLPSSIFKIYPNPTGDSFTVEIQHSTFNIQHSTLKIYDVKGKLVYQSEIQNPKSEISSKGWEKGIYFVTLISEGEVIAKEKVVIE